jgi:isoleucyl-tRNA synthetase
LGSFYLDILKDRLYTAGENSKARRSAQNALFHITQALTRLIAPILSFTGEEVWEVLNSNNTESVFLGEWYVLPEHRLEDEIIEQWNLIRSDRDFVNKQIEELRAEGKLGSSLQAELSIRRLGSAYDRLARLGDDLRFVFITSGASLQMASNTLAEGVEVATSSHAKCDRCWHYRADVGSDVAHPTICGRCVSNLFGDGEARHYA